MVLLVDFNAKCTNWYKHDNNSYSYRKNSYRENFIAVWIIYQVINEPTHIIENSSSCIDLIFTSEPNIVTESGAHPSLHPNCHHQVIYDKFNLKDHI